MEEEGGTYVILYRIFVIIVVLFIIVLLYSWAFGSENLIKTTQHTLTPNVTITLTDENAKVTATALEDGYLYSVIAQPALEIVAEEEVNAFALIHIKDVDVKAKVNGQENTFATKDGATRIIFIAELSSSLPPLQEWRGQPLKNEVPVLVKSSTGNYLVVKARIREVVDLDSPLIDTTPYKECKADFELYCDNGLKYTHYLKPCGSDDPISVCQQNVEICGGTAEIKVSDTDCGTNQVQAEILYRDGKKWDVGETVGISFWKDTECTRKYTDFNELLFFCCPSFDRCDKIGGEEKMNTGLIQ